MPSVEQFHLPQLAQLQQSRGNPQLFLAASMLDMEILPHLYTALNSLGKSETLDVVLYGRGGEINAARRIGLLLRNYCRHLHFIVPHHCESALTALVLCGDSIVAGEMAIFSPIDPRFNGEVNNESDLPTAMASEDIRVFPEMAKTWFGIQSEQARSELLAALAASVFPTTLSGLYRATREVETIANELLEFQLPHQLEVDRKKIVDDLLHGFHSHSFAITGSDLARFGLNIKRCEEAEQLTWDMAMELQCYLGGAARQTPEDPRNDVFIATCEKILVRQWMPGHMSPSWHTQINGG